MITSTVDLSIVCCPEYGPYDCTMVIGSGFTVEEVEGFGDLAPQYQVRSSFLGHRRLLLIAGSALYLNLQTSAVQNGIDFTGGGSR